MFNDPKITAEIQTIGNVVIESEVRHVFKVMRRSNSEWVRTVYAVKEQKGILCFLFYYGDGEWAWDIASLYEPYPQ